MSISILSTLCRRLVTASVTTFYSFVRVLNVRLYGATMKDGVQETVTELKLRKLQR